MSTETIKSESPTEQSADQSIPPLEAGDRLTSAEFRRRYEVMPDCDHAELIQGVVYMPSPVSATGHGEPHSEINCWLCVYSAHTSGVHCGDNSTLWLDFESAPQPDVYLRLDEAAGGQSKIVDGYIHGGPELIVEISASTVSYDLHDKLNAYHENAVKEYVVWRVRDREVDWFVLREGQFVRAEPTKDGVQRSEIFPGLWLDTASLISGDIAKVLATLQAGLDSEPHQEFVKRIGQ
jgi:Uma2 family endonuclease